SAIEAGWNDILDLRCAGKGVHGEGEGTQGNTAWNQPLGDTGFFEQRRRKRVDRKNHYEQADTAVGQYGTRQNDGKDGMLLSKSLHNRMRNTLCQKGVFHHLTKHRAQQEYREKEFHVD